MAEFAGSLGERVEAETLMRNGDGTGGMSGDFAPAGAHWAALSPEGRGAGAEGEALRGRPRYRLTMRAATGVGLGTRFRWKGKLLHVLRVEPDPRAPDRVRLLVEDRTA